MIYNSSGGRGGTAEDRYMCHECHRNFTFSPSTSAAFACVHCRSSFVEQLVTARANIANPNHIIRRPVRVPAPRGSPPPAARCAVNSLREFKVTAAAPNSAQPGESCCAVCKEELEVGDLALQMPCEHVFHKVCLLPWLELRNSCPLCRHELPADHPGYERRRSGGDADGAAERGARGMIRSTFSFLAEVMIRVLDDDSESDSADDDYDSYSADVSGNSEDDRSA